MAVADAGTVAEALDHHERLEQAEDLNQLDEWLTQLPDRQREALTLRYLEQLSLRETAAAMGCALGTAKATIAQALGRLRTLAVENER